MAYKFNRGCWVESSEYRLVEGEERDERGWLSIEGRIRLACRLYNALQDKFEEDPDIALLLERLHEEIDSSLAAMVELGIVRGCTICDETAPEGSCCSVGLENKFDPILLLINLLMGSEITEPGTRPDSCRFLGSRGCRLKVKHMLCIDYLCPALERELGAEGLMRIQKISGAQIETAFFLSEAIKRVIVC